MFSLLFIAVVGMAVALDQHKWFPSSVSPAGPNRIGPAIASAATIAPTHPVHHVTGTAAIATITPPDPGFQGEICLIADAIWTWTAAGNIALAGTTTAANKAVYFTYDPSTAKWYPDKIA